MVEDFFCFRLIKGEESNIDLRGANILLINHICWSQFSLSLAMLPFPHFCSLTPSSSGPSHLRNRRTQMLLDKPNTCLACFTQFFCLADYNSDMRREKLQFVSDPPFLLNDFFCDMERSYQNEHVLPKQNCSTVLCGRARDRAVKETSSAELEVIKSNIYKFSIN